MKGYVLNLDHTKNGLRFVATVSFSRDLVSRQVGPPQNPKALLSPPLHVVLGVESVPESYCLNKGRGPHNAWVLAGTDVTTSRVLELFEANGIRFLTPRAQALFEKLTQSSGEALDKAKLVAEWKLRGVVPDVPGHLDRPELPLSDYQRTALAFIAGRSASLFMDTGTGKTPVAIAAVCLQARSAPEKSIRVLVICPAQARGNWAVEIERFSPEDYRIEIVRGNRERRVQQIASAAGQVSVDDRPLTSWLVCSYDSAVATLDALKTVPWDVLICDESHGFKDPSTLRWRVIRELRDFIPRRISLTGTPIGNSFADLWSEFEFLGVGRSGFMTHRYFKQRYGKYLILPGLVGVEKLVGLRRLPELRERLVGLAFQCSKTEAGLNLPPKHPDTWEVEMTPKQTEVYYQMKERLVVEIADRPLEVMTIRSVLTKLLRLAQITSGHVSWDPTEPDGERRVEQIDTVNPKVEAILEMVGAEDRDPLGKTLVWCCFRADFAALSDRLTAVGIDHVQCHGGTQRPDRDLAVERFNRDPSCRLFIGNPQVAGEALNLLGYDPAHPDGFHTRCSHEVFFSSNWSAIQRTQAEDRPHRRGTRGPVRVTDLIVPGTIDEEIRKVVAEKRASADRISDVQGILKRVLGVEVSLK